MEKNWILNIEKNLKKIHSQSNQDGIIQHIITHITIENKFCVEFGYNSDKLEGGTGANTTYLIKNNNWDYLLLDGDYENKLINLHAHYLTKDNICDIFEKYKVPKNLGYLSIDVDSIDLWLLDAILSGGYRPSFFSTEYNQHFPLHCVITCSPDYKWEGDRVYGASLKAFIIVATKHNYTLVYAGKHGNCDAFFIRNDLIGDATLPKTNNNYHSFFHSLCTSDSYKTMLDYENYIKTNDIEESKIVSSNVVYKYMCRNSIHPNVLTVYRSPYNKIRLGKDNDGGYIICDIPDIKYDVFLSGGILNDISFEEDFCNKYPNVKCYAHDGTIKNIKIKNNNVIFVRKNIGAINNKITTDLTSFIDNESIKDIFIKMDIEGGEINWLSNLSIEQIDKFSQIVIEFHHPYSTKEINVFDKLERTHVLVHFHANNCCGIRSLDEIIVPNVFECTYINKKYYKIEQKYNEETIPSNIDMKNVLTKDEIYLSHKPFVGGPV